MKIKVLLKFSGRGCLKKLNNGLRNVNSFGSWLLTFKFRMIMPTAQPTNNSITQSVIFEPKINGMGKKRISIVRVKAKERAIVSRK
jgi:hypothetical protein